MSTTPEGERSEQGAASQPGTPEPGTQESSAPAETTPTEAVTVPAPAESAPVADPLAATQRIDPNPTQQIDTAATQALPAGAAPQAGTPAPTPVQPVTPAGPVYPAPTSYPTAGAPQQPAPPQGAHAYGTPPVAQQPAAPAPTQPVAPAQPRFGQLAPQQPVPPATGGPAAPADPLAAFRGPDAAAGDGAPGDATEGLAAAGAAGGSRTRPQWTRVWLPVVAVGVVAAVLASLGTAVALDAFGSSSSTRSSDISALGEATTDSAPVSGSTSDDPDWQAVASAVQASVVSIQVTTSSGTAEGSGVIIDEDGDILTNNHVVTDAEDDAVQVTLSDGRIYTADVVGTDSTTDLAVVKLQDAPDDLSPAALGDSSDVEVGDPVMAVGNPLGLANTVTTGIVSALDRPVSTTEDGSSEAVVTNAIQIDAAINPGNSGGPLFNAEGQVIGITSSIATTSSESGSIGLGFAIPVNVATMISSQLLEDGTAEHAFLGVGLSDGTATADGVTRAGALVMSVTSGSPASDAGIEVDDTIVAIDGKAVAGAESLTGYVRAYASGDQVTLTLVRDGESLDVDVTLATREETTTSSDESSGSSDSGSGSDDSGSSDSGSSGSGSDDSGSDDSGSSDSLENMTPEQLWEWFQQQQDGS
ncbi:MAG TPA: trypsin-like peptidase domain-containing protein [Cellulomonas sp.]